MSWPRSDEENGTHCPWFIDHGAMLQRARHDPELLRKSDGNGFTLLHVAAIDGNVQVVQELLALVSDVNARCSWGDTPLAAAVYLEPLNINGLPLVVQMLLEHGADVRLPGHMGLTALHLAEGEVEDAVMDLLINAAASAFAREARAALHR